MTLGQWLLLALTSAAVLAMFWRGRAPERWAAAAFLVDMLGTPLVEAVHVSGVRWGVAALSFALLAILVALGLSVRRWWLLAAAGVQTVALLTYALPLIEPDAQVWATVSVRYLLWLQLMLLGLLGVWEARRAPYAQPAS